MAVGHVLATRILCRRVWAAWSARCGRDLECVGSTCIALELVRVHTHPRSDSCYRRACRLEAGPQPDNLRPVLARESLRIRCPCGFGRRLGRHERLGAAPECCYLSPRGHLGLVVDRAALYPGSGAVPLRIPPVFPAPCHHLLPSCARGAASSPPLPTGKSRLQGSRGSK